MPISRESNIVPVVGLKRLPQAHLYLLILLLSKPFLELMNKIDIEGSNVLGDKAYGTKEIRTYIKEHGAVVVIPPKSNTKDPWEVDYCLYKECHLVECFFQKIKWFRRIATRYDKLDKSFLSFVYMAACMIWLL